MTQCTGGECPLQHNCAHKDEYQHPSASALTRFEFPPFNPDDGTCTQFFSNGNEPPETPSTG